jgi:hypothetical protein
VIAHEKHYRFLYAAMPAILSALKKLLLKSWILALAISLFFNLKEK